MRINWLWLFICIAATAGALDGASVLAAIDGQPAVTVADIEVLKSAGNVFEGGTAVDAENLRELADTMVTAAIIVKEAEAAGYDRATQLQPLYRDYERGLLRQRGWDDIVAHVAVTEEEIRDYYDADTKWRKCSALLTRNRAEADAAKAALDAGAPWNEVVTRYAFMEADRASGGDRAFPLVYDGGPIGLAVWGTPVGSYTAPIPDYDGLRWVIYRVDLITHGRTDTFEEAAPGIRGAITRLKANALFDALAASTREEVEVKRDNAAIADIIAKSWEEFCAQWGSLPVSSAGGIEVTGREWTDKILQYYDIPAPGVEELRTQNPADFEYIALGLLTELEDYALLEYSARNRLMDKDPAFVRELKAYRDRYLIDAFIANEFTAKLPPIPEEVCARYYSEHPELFHVPERIELYVYAIPAKAKLEAFHRRVLAGEDAVLMGEDYNHARAREVMYSYEPPSKLPPEQTEWLAVVRIPREPVSGEAESPWAEELRPKAFRWTEKGKVSEVFRLNDGRWAFYTPVFYQPPQDQKYDDAGVRDRCSKACWAEYSRGPEVEKAGADWVAALKAKHRIEYAPAEVFEKAAAELRR